MEIKPIYSRIQSIENDIAKLNNIVLALKSTDLKKYPENYEELSTEASLRAERMACQMRNLVFIANNTARPEHLRKIALAQGILINSENQTLSIKLPGLLPKRKVHTNMSYLHEPLDFALNEYVKKHSLPLYKDCTICFSQVYDKSLSSRRVRDYDNLEFKQLLDIVATYTLFDDTALLCDSFHTTEFGESDYTMIHIMAKQDFPDWLRTHKNHIDSISEIL